MTIGLLSMFASANTWMASESRNESRQWKRLVSCCCCCWRGWACFTTCSQLSSPHRCTSTSTDRHTCRQVGSSQGVRVWGEGQEKIDKKSTNGDGWQTTLRVCTTKHRLSLQSGWFWVTSTASFRERLLEFRSCWIVFILVVQARVLWWPPPVLQGGSC